MSFNRYKDIRKFGNKYLPSAYKTQVEFRSHYSGKKMHLMVREIQYVTIVLSMYSILITVDEL